MKPQVTSQFRRELAPNANQLAHSVHAIQHICAFMGSDEFDTLKSICLTIQRQTDHILKCVEDAEYAATHMRPRAMIVKAMHLSVECMITCHPQGEDTWADVVFDCVGLVGIDSGNAMARHILEMELEASVRVQIQPHLIYPITKVFFDWSE